MSPVKDKDWLPKALRLAEVHSPYLASLLEKEPALKSELAQNSPEKIFETLLTQAFDGLDSESDTPAFARKLRQLKQRAALLIALADLGDVWDLKNCTQKLSQLADNVVKLSLRHLLRRACSLGVLTLKNTDDPEENCGLIVCGVGKLGARELNYSSDIDLLVIYDESRIALKNPEEIPNFCVRLTRELVKILDEKTEDGYVFRTDLRLRPDPGSMPLAVSFKAAEIYYGSFGQNWERAAMIKARVLAGDKVLAKDFTSLMTAWIWRRNLDFATIQDIHSIKRQIDSQQAGKGLGTPFPNGFNIKLGHGGIREIEFFVQTQQLIYGGKNPELRVSGTLDALNALARSGHVTLKAAEELARAYIFLRTVEHRLQMVDDRQTHSLPETGPELEQMARFSGFSDLSSFNTVLSQHLSCVSGHYARLFGESPSLATEHGSLVFTGTEDDPETVRTLAQMGYASPSAITATIRGWHHGRLRATRSLRARQILTELVPALLEGFSKTPHPDEAFMRFDGFLNQLPAGVQIFSLFQQNPVLLKTLAGLMGTFPLLAEDLARHPHALEGLLNRDFFEPLPDIHYLQSDLGRIITTATNYEDTLDLTRRWAREKRFQSAIHVLQALSPPAAAGRYFAAIAETALTTLMPRIEAEFKKQHGAFKSGAFALLGLGGLGARDMTSDSDLDLIALYKTDKNEDLSNGLKPLSPSQYYIRLTQRLVSALSSPTAEGKLYETDFRLRPQGESGPLATSLEGFIEYEKNHAWTWERMCLLRARVLYGSDALAQKISATVREVLAAPQDAKKLKNDISDMRQKIEKEYPAISLWDIRHQKGGLMDLLFLTQYLTLKEACNHPELLDTAGVPETLSLLETRGILAPDAGQKLSAAFTLFRGIEQFLNLAAEKPFEPQKTQAAFREALTRAVDGTASFESVEKKLTEALTLTRRYFEQFLG